MPGPVLGGASDPAVTNGSPGSVFTAPIPMEETDLSREGDAPQWAGFTQGSLQFSLLLHLDFYVNGAILPQELNKCPF